MSAEREEGFRRQLDLPAGRPPFGQRPPPPSHRDPRPEESAPPAHPAPLEEGDESLNGAGPGGRTGHWTRRYFPVFPIASGLVAAVLVVSAWTLSRPDSQSVIDESIGDAQGSEPEEVPGSDSSSPAADDDLATADTTPTPTTNQEAGPNTSTTQVAPPTTTNPGPTTVATPAPTTPATEPESTTTTSTTAPPETTTTTAPPVVVPPPDLCEVQTQDNASRGVEVKYRELDDFASSFLFYSADQELLYDTTTLEDNPTNRVYREGFYEKEWDINVNPTGFEPRDVYYVSAVEPEGESEMIRCIRTSL